MLWPGIFSIFGRAFHIASSVPLVSKDLGPFGVEQHRGKPSAMARDHSEFSAARFSFCLQTDFTQTIQAIARRKEARAY